MSDIVETELLGLYDQLTETLNSLNFARQLYLTFISIFGLISIFLIHKTFRILLVRWRYRHIPGPPTKGIMGFFFGLIVEDGRLRKEGKIFGDYMVECHETYGEVFKFQWFDKMNVCTTNKEAIKEILITKNFPKYDIFLGYIAYPFKERFLGDGLITDSDHQHWKHRRSLFNPGFQRNVLITFVNQFNAKADSLMQRLRLLADGNTVVNLFAEFNHATLDAIALIAFGMNIDSINNKDPDLSVAISGCLKLLDSTLRDPLSQIKPSRRKEIKQLKDYISYIRKAGKDKILERFEALKTKEHIPNDILSSILHSWKDEDMDLEALADDFVTFFIAGQETTANTLGFCFLELGRNNDVFLKAREEIDKVLGERTEISFQDAVELKYCSCIFKEALRLYPPVPGISTRLSTDEMIINGYKIPANTYFSLHPYVSGRSDKFFKNPLEFKPERFLKDPDTLEKSVENYTFFPFSLGPRNCIGQNFAQIEGVIMIAKLISKFDFKLDPTQTYILTQNLTIRPRDGTNCILSTRSL